MDIDVAVAQYEGLIFKTASMISGKVEIDFDDIRQELRVKAWKALVSFDAGRSRMTERAYVFSCVMNGKKDLLKRPRRNLAYIEDEAPTSGEAGRARDRFEERYLCEHFDTCDLSLLDGLTEVERQVVLMTYTGLVPMEIRELLEMTRIEVEGILTRVREKLVATLGAEHGLDPLPEPVPAPPARAARSVEPSPVGRLPRPAARPGARSSSRRVAA